MFRIMITSLGGLKTLSATALHVCVKCLLMTNKTLGSRIKYISKKKGKTEETLLYCPTTSKEHSSFQTGCTHFESYILDSDRILVHFF